MVDNLKSAFAKNLKWTWMDEKTRKAAEKKVQTLFHVSTAF